MLSISNLPSPNPEVMATHMKDNVARTEGRVGYADALARECNNPWAAAYVHEIMQEDPDILSRAFEAKPADLTWYRCTTPKERPAYSKHLSELPEAKVFKQAGTALMNTDIGHHANNAMLSFEAALMVPHPMPWPIKMLSTPSLGVRLSFIAAGIVPDLQMIIVCMPTGIPVPITPY